METQAETDEHVCRCELAGSEALTPLFSPLTIRGLRLPNRFVMAPMTRSFSPRGVPPPDTAPYYRRRAEGGTGLLVTEGIAIPHEAAIGLSGVDVPDIPQLLGEEALGAGQVHIIGGGSSTESSSSRRRRSGLSMPPDVQ